MGFHDGELAIQQRVGVRTEADRLAGMLEAPNLNGGIGRFLTERTFAALTGRDHTGRLWVSPLTGPPGFLTPQGPASLRVRATPATGDPLHGLAKDQPVGLLVIEFATRRRVRINGVLAIAAPDALTIEVDQAYGNCPRYIQQRMLQPAHTAATTAPGQNRRSGRLTRPEVGLIRRADTFFLGSTHPERGNDASHRGGPPGFLRTDPDGHHLRWPDYPGNNMFNSLGNLAVNPTAALLVIDYTTGTTLHLSGTAAIAWSPPGAASDDGGTGRLVRFTLEAALSGPPLPLRLAHTSEYPRSPH